MRAESPLTAGDANTEALFHCQQAAEKAPKAFLTFHEIAFRKTHDLGDLSPECVELDDSLRLAITQAEGLTRYAWQFRFPGAPYDPDSTEAQTGLQKAEAVLREVELRLGEGPRTSSEST